MPRMFPDAEMAIARALIDGGIVTAGKVGVEVPANLDRDNLYPFVRVLRRGGPSNEVFDFPRIDVDVLAKTRASGYPLAERIREYLTRRVHLRAYRNLDFVDCESGPFELQWDSTGIVRRYLVTFTARTRKVNVV